MLCKGSLQNRKGVAHSYPTPQVPHSASLRLLCVCLRRGDLGPFNSHSGESQHHALTQSTCCLTPHAVPHHILSHSMPCPTPHAVSPHMLSHTTLYPTPWTVPHHMLPHHFLFHSILCHWRAYPFALCIRVFDQGTITCRAGVYPTPGT